MDAVFTYGTLEIPAIMEAVTGQRFSFAEGTAENFSCFLLHDRIYPGMIAATGKATPGKIYLEVDSQAIQLLDHFEDPIYQRKLIAVQNPLEENVVTAYAYIIPQTERAVLSNDPWDREHFLDHYYDEYLQRCRIFYQRMTA